MANENEQTTAQLISNAITELHERGTRAVLATVVESSGNYPTVGAKLFVNESGKRVGSLGDSDLDNAIASQAITFLQTRDEARIFKTSEFVPQLAQLSETKILFERLEAEPRLVIAGAGHVGASLARLATIAGYRVTLIDDRAEFVDRNLFTSSLEENIELVAAEDWQDEMRRAIGNGRAVSVAIVTRGHKQDEECLRAAIAARPDYIGMIGSKRRTNIVLEKLREEGADEADLKKVRAPIGLDIGAVSPEEVALSILTEIVAERRGGSGAPLSSWRRS
ncbi:MAG TPA: XdhC/CoxI family protein [Pyrinomonadaceae bacterium]|nr:XdhC/CoxI family protein [Pyrinomonadaceae bacterium]